MQTTTPVLIIMLINEEIDVETLNSFPKPRDLEFIGMSNLFFPNGTLFSLHNFLMSPEWLAK